MKRFPSPPRWLAVVIIAALLPVFSLPALLSAAPAGNDTVTTMLWIYPFYLLLSGWLAWISWNERPYMTWILIGLMVLTSAAAWALVNSF